MGYIVKKIFIWYTRVIKAVKSKKRRKPLSGGLF